MKHFPRLTVYVSKLNSDLFMQSKHSNLQPFWFWFFSAITLYTAYDYYKHLSYQDEPVFRDHAIQWLLFSLVSMVVMCLIIYGVHLLLQKWPLTRHWLFDGVAVGAALTAHITITGPLWDQLIWRAGDLNFMFNFKALLIVLGIFYGIRILYYVLVEKRHTKGSAHGSFTP